MKRKWIAVALLGVAIIALLVIVLGKDDAPPGPRVETWFDGFTNTPAGPFARVAVHFLPKYMGAQWLPDQIYRQQSGQWELWTPSPELQKRSYEVERYNPPLPGRPDGKTINMHFLLPMENTNDTWRSVMEVKEYRRAYSRTLRKIHVLWNEWRHLPPPPFSYDGPHYYVTNETRKVNQP